jgi:hypothetical protein
LQRWITVKNIGIVTGMAGVWLVVSLLYSPFERSFALPWLFHLGGAIDTPADVVRKKESWRPVK